MLAGRLAGRLAGLLLFLIGGCMTAANRPLQLLSSVDPDFPAAAKTQGLQGYVVIEYTVSVEGQVVNARVVESEPAGVFDQSALAAVTQWLYKPMVRKGQVLQAEKVHSRLEFRLGEPERYENY